MKTRPILGALLTSLLLAGCAASTATASAPPGEAPQSAILTDARVAGERAWRFVEGTTVQAVSFVNAFMTACHESAARLTRR